jgi:hypothetical protein
MDYYVPIHFFVNVSYPTLSWPSTVIYGPSVRFVNLVDAKCAEDPQAVSTGDHYLKVVE